MYLKLSICVRKFVQRISVVGWILERLQWKLLGTYICSRLKMATLLHVFAYLGHWLSSEWPLVRCAVWIQNANLPFCRLCNCSVFCNLKILFQCMGRRSISAVQNLCLLLFATHYTSTINNVPKNKLEEDWFNWPLKGGSEVQVGPIDNDSRSAFVKHIFNLQ